MDDIPIEKLKILEGLKIRIDCSQVDIALKKTERLHGLLTECKKIIANLQALDPGVLAEIEQSES